MGHQSVTGVMVQISAINLMNTEQTIVTQCARSHQRQLHQIICMCYYSDKYERILEDYIRIRGRRDGAKFLEAELHESLKKTLSLSTITVT